MKWIAFKIILAIATLVFVVEFILWRNLIPEYFFSAYADKVNVGDTEIAVFVDKDFIMQSFHGHTYRFYVWVRKQNFFYSLSHSDYLGKYFEVDVDKIVPYYVSMSKEETVKFVYVSEDRRYPNHRDTYALIQDETGEIIALDIFEEKNDTLNTIESKCRIRIPERGASVPAESVQFEEASLKEIKRVINQYTFKELDCLDSLAKEQKKGFLY